METLQKYSSYLGPFDLQAGMPTIIYFNATWCGRCHMFHPRLELLQLQYMGRINIVNVNIDQHPAFATAAEVHSLPTLFFVSRKGNIDRIAGILSFSHMKTLIEEMLKE